MSASPGGPHSGLITSLICLKASGSWAGWAEASFLDRTRWHALYGPARSLQVCTPALPKQSRSSCFEVYLQVSNNRNDLTCTPPSSLPSPHPRPISPLSCVHIVPVYREAACHTQTLHFSLSRRHAGTAPPEPWPPEPSPPEAAGHSQRFVLKELQQGPGECWG